MAIPSLAMIPSGYKDGKVYSVLPENGDGDFTFSRGSHATRVNSEGLIESMDYEGSELVLNGDFSQEGSELVTNGSFDADSDWTKASNWTISGGSANADGSSGGVLSQTTSGISIGKTYKIEYTISNYVSGSFRFSYAGVGESFNTSNGTYTTYRVAASTSNLLSSSSISFIGSIDNVSVKEVGQDWTLGSGVSIADSKLTKSDPSVGNTSAQQVGIFTVGKTYKYNLVVSGNLTASDKVVVFAKDFTSAGTYEGYYTATAQSLLFSLRGSTNVYSVDSISIKEVGPNWTFDTGWSIVDNKIVHSSGGDVVYQELTGITSGKTYKLEYNLSGRTVGQMDVRMNSTVIDDNVNVNGDRVITFVSNGNNKLLFAPTNLFDGSVSNISVIEIIEDTDLPRLDYTDSSCPSLLLEPQSTNFNEYSEDFSNASWLKGDVSIADNQTISPNGILSSDKLIEDNSNSNHQLYSVITSVQSNNAYTLSLFAKKGERDIIQISVGGTSFLEGNVYANFDLANGSIGNGNYLDAKIDMLQNDWYKCSVSLTTISTSNFNISIQPKLTSSSSRNLAYQGDGTSGLYIWGAQLEELSYATSYIPTNGAISTRLADACTDAGNVSTFNSEEGVLYIEGSKIELSSISGAISISDSTTSNRIVVNGVASSIENRYSIAFKVNNTDLYSQNITLPFDINGFAKLAIKWSVSSFSVASNGQILYTENNNFSFPINTLNRVGFDSGTGLVDFYGKCKDLRVYNTALTDAELIELTTI